MKKIFFYRFIIPIIFLVVFSFGLKQFYSNREITYMPAPLIFYDMFMPYLLGIVLSFIGNKKIYLNKEKIIFLIIVNILIFLIEVVVLSQFKNAIPIELHILISLLISYISNITLLELKINKISKKRKYDK